MTHPITRQLDMNSDLGESFGPWVMGDDAAMLDIVDSANVACGGHASDPDTMFRTLTLCAEKGVSIGAHPGYADREGFGRRIIPMAPQAITRMVGAQIGALQGIAALAGTRVRYVKPHGALSNFASVNRDAADAIAAAVAALPGDLAMLAVAGSDLEAASRAVGLKTIGEIFADRGYTPDGQLVPRGQPGDLLHDADAAAERILRWLDTGLMEVVGGDPVPLQAGSVCVHGDSAGAVDMATRLRARLRAEGVTPAPFC